MSPARAVLFDIDGTLVDSNYLHVEAWAHAFRDVDVFVPSWRIHRFIGADSSELLGQLMGTETDEVQQQAKQLHTEYYEALIPRLEVFPVARDLVSALAADNVRVVLATSAPEEELEALLAVLDIDDFTFAVTSAEDVEKAKPSPDIVAVALEKAEVDPADAVMVGDSVWDIVAAGKAGVAAIGLLSGGTGRDELMSAGAVAVFENIAELAASPELLLPEPA